jgi:hypothetical protein
VINHLNIDMNKKAIALGIILLGLLIIAVLLFREQIFYNTVSDIEKKDDLFVQTVFPSLGNRPRFFSDPLDSNILWFYGSGAIFSYDSIKSEIVDVYTAKDGINSSLTSATKVGNSIFYSYQGGFKKLNLETKKIWTYTEEDGLISNSNIYLFPDPADENIIWIGTFKGLSRFNINEESFQNFDDEIVGIDGSVVVNGGVKVGDDYVWVAVTANAYQSGGIARYDKARDLWKWWGLSDFGLDGRIDIFSFEAKGESAFVEAQDDLYKYNAVNGKWDMFMDGGEKRGLRSGFVYTDECLYGIWEVGPNEHELKCVSEGGEIIRRLSTGTFERYVFDQSNGRLILLEGWNSFKETQDIPYGVYDLKTNSLSEFSLELPDYFNAFPLGLFDDKLLYKSGKDLYQYHIDSGKHQIVEGADFISDTARAVEANGKIIVVGMDEGIGGTSGATLLYFDKDAGRVEMKIKTGGLLDPVSKALYFINYDRNREEFFGKKLDLNKIDLVLSDGEINESEMEPASPEEVKKFNTSNRFYEVEVEINNKAARFLVDMWSVKGNEVHTSITIDGVTSTTTVPVAPPRHNPFGWLPSVEVEDVEMDYLNPDVVWMATRDRGLVKMNIKTKTSKLFSVSNGLASNSITEIFPGERQIVLHDIGIYVYNLD